MAGGKSRKALYTIAMDLSKNTVLKENYTFFTADEAGFIQGGEHGLYNRDTRFLNRYAWDFGRDMQLLMRFAERPDRLSFHYAELDNAKQLLAVRRELVLGVHELTDTLMFENSEADEKMLECTLTVAADFADLFEARGWFGVSREITETTESHGLFYQHTAQDGAQVSVKVRLSVPVLYQDGVLKLRIHLPAKSTHTVRVTVAMHNPFETGMREALSYEGWRKQFTTVLPDATDQAVLERATEDLRALLLFDETGLMPAAGIPWFVAAFGRDALLTAYMLLPQAPQVAKGTLKYLAHHQAKDFDTFRNAQPGKILHEMRYGELSRIGKTPHRPYYGTVDATPLFIILLHRFFEVTGDLELVRQLRPHWAAALEWMSQYGDLDGDGFLEFEGALSQGLSVQSWKDSGDSMSHADGTLAQGRLAVSEVQGYAYTAYQAAAGFYTALGESDNAQAVKVKAAQLKDTFHQAFWLPDLQTYAMALDGDKQPLQVHNSDAGQLLWTGIVPDEIAPKLVATLFSDVNWSGWGVRTLGQDEVRYNPVSYHNGSVWPHDNTLIAAGLKRYGFTAEATRIARACFDIAKSQSDLRLPELIGGYPRTAAPPVPYPAACRPQAWDAAALVYLSAMLTPADKAMAEVVR
jgi:glycogen debranching enzyme